jgi:hypothetical protein
MMIRVYAVFLSFVLAFAPAYSYALSASDLSFLRLDTVKTVAGGLIADYKYSAIGGALLAAKDFNVSNTVMGDVWRNRWRLGKAAAGGVLAQLAVEGALRAVDWILDPANNRIYKELPAGEIVYCVGQPGTYKGAACSPTIRGAFDLAHPDASDSANDYHDTYTFSDPPNLADLVRNLPPGGNVDYYDHYRHTITRKSDGWSYDVENVAPMRAFKTDDVTEKEADRNDIADAVERAEQSSPGTKEALATPTPEEDVNGDHQPNEDAKKKAAPDTPADCPTGQVKDSTGKCVPKDTTTTGGGTAFKLPEFCTWAKTMCDWFDWTKKEPETPSSNNKVDIKRRTASDIGVDFDQQQQDYVRWSGSCPAPKTAVISLAGTSTNFVFDFQPFCDMLTTARPVVIGFAYLSALYIVTGVRGDE